MPGVRFLGLRVIRRSFKSCTKFSIVIVYTFSDRCTFSAYGNRFLHEKNLSRCKSAGKKENYIRKLSLWIGRELREGVWIKSSFTSVDQREWPSHTHPGKRGNGCTVSDNWSSIMWMKFLGFKTYHNFPSFNNNLWVGGNRQQAKMHERQTWIPSPLNPTQPHPILIDK